MSRATRVGGPADMASRASNLDTVRRYRDAFGSFEPHRYTPMLVADPVYHAGMTMRRGVAAFRQNTGAGAVLYPFGQLRSSERRAIAEGEWVAMLIDREAVTNKLAHYENIYTMFYEVVDDHIATQVELLDFRVSGDKFALEALGPELRAPGTQAVPAARATLPDPSDNTSSARAKRTALAFLDAFLTFDPHAFLPLLVEEPAHQVGMTRRSGRAAFEEIARIGRLLYPQGIAERTHHVLVSDGRTVATLMSMRACTNAGVDNVNLYGVFLDVHDDLVVTYLEVLDHQVAAAAFDLGALGV